MRALLCTEYGPFDALRLTDVPAPPLTPDGVRIGVKAAGVGFAASLVVAGKHQTRPTVPFVPGTETAGVVLECGAEVTRVRAGDRVIGCAQWGGFAEQVIVPEQTVFPIPDPMGFAEATNFCTVYGTAYGALKWRAALGPGETLLVHGAAGASGLPAIEIGKALGATVIAVAGGPQKLAVCREHGADHGIDHQREDIRERVLALGGADVVFDPVGGSAFDASLRCVNPEARILLIGFAGGTVPQIPANILLVKNVSAVGFYWGHYLGWGRTPPGARNWEDLRAAFAEMFRWYGQGLLKPTVSARFPLAGFKEAMAVVLERKAIGKVVLELA
jgi:NADPH2:quinone reductase